jgi:hypothetical protein
MASSSQQSSSYSTSEPVVVQTEENKIINALSGVAAGLADQMYTWAQGVYAKTSQITDQAVGNFFQVSQQMMGLSDNLTGQYNDVFAPQNRSLAREADSYASQSRIRANMGAAGATAAQAGDAQLRGAEESLRSYGIDPSSGRYAALDKAAAVQNSANIAGQMNQQRDRDIATGQRLRSEAVQVGATLPAAIANVNNTGIQANTGASNAILANANTGANLNRLPNEFLKTAMDVKLPPVGQKSSGSSQSTGQSSSPDRGGGGGSGGGSGGGPGGGYGGSGGGGPAWMPQHSDAQARVSSGGGGARMRGGSAAGIYNMRPYGADDYSDPTGQNYDPMSSIDPNSFQYGSDDYYQPQDGYNMHVGSPGYSDDPFQSYDDPWSNQQYGGEGSGLGEFADYDTFTGGDGATDTPWGNINYDPSANAVDTGWDQLYDTPVATDWGNGAAAYQDYGASAPAQSYDAPAPSYDTTSSGSDYYAGDYTGSYEDYGGAYAKGGPVPGGGRVPPSMSPSGGQRTDDVPAVAPGGPARLNANEFVIPEDVALWKGQEFFQKLIDQSRMRNATAPAKPQMQQMR